MDKYELNSQVLAGKNSCIDAKKATNFLPVTINYLFNFSGSQTLVSDPAVRPQDLQTKLEFLTRCL
jgi:hypothetical protein